MPVNLSPLGGAAAQFFDNNGVILSGGKIYTYAAGTTTPQAAYTSASGATPHANPIILDSAGRVPGGEIWLTDGVDYKFVVETSTAILIGTYDNLSGINETVTATEIVLSPSGYTTATNVQTAFNNLGSSTGSGYTGFLQSGLSAVSRSSLAKMRDTVSVQDFGATGDGVTNDAAAIQLALNTGKSIFFDSGKTYNVTGTLSATADNQIINLNGAKIDFSGASNGFSITGGLQNVTICDGEIEGQNMTGGYVISIINADRSTISNVRVYSPYNFLYVQKANVCDVTNAWVNNIRGAYGIHWFGNASNRSDILRLIGVNLSSDHVAVGIMWDGDCNTLQTQSVTIVKPTIGVHIRNTSGGSIPAFGLFDDIEIDFPSSYGVKIDAGEDFFFSPLFYCHGSLTASGVYVGASIPDDRVTISGGKITSHATYGIENYSRVMAVNLVIFDNATDNFYNEDEIYVKSPRIEVDGTGFFGINAGNPIVNWASTDTDGFIRSTNVRYMNVNGTARFQASDQTDAIEIYVNGSLKRITVGAADSGGTGFRMLRVTN
jgi:hypothetical protein